MPKPAPDPLILNDAQVAALLGMAVRRFKGQRKALIARGFPDRDPLLRGTYRRKIVQWLDIRHGIEPKIGTNGAGTDPRDDEDWT